MRLAYGLALSTFLVSGAHAADYLRGMIQQQPTYAAPQATASYDWSGAYAGGNIGIGTGDFRSVNNTAALTDRLFPTRSLDATVSSNILFPSRGTGRGRNYGGFIGYNTMWDDVVVGVEAEFSATDMDRKDAMSPIVGLTDYAGTNEYIINATGRRRSTLPYYGVARARFGWAVGRFMPFATLGVVAGSVRTTDTIEGVITTNAFNGVTGGYDFVSNTPFSRTVKKSGNSWGYAVGAGLDWAVTDNVFLRGTWEYISIGGPNSTRVTFQTGKVGAGVKF